MSASNGGVVRSTEENPYRAMTREEVKAVAQLREEEGAFDTGMCCSQLYLTVICIGSIIWLLAGGFVVQYFDVITALRYDPNIDRYTHCNCSIASDRRVRPYLAAGGVCLGIAGLIAMYCILILATIMKIPDYDRHSPWAVPASTIFGALGLVL